MDSEIQDLGKRKSRRILILILGIAAIASIILIIIIFTLPNDTSNGAWPGAIINSPLLDLLRNYIVQINFGLLL